MVKQKRKFGGKVYTLFTWEDTRKKAEAEAADGRRMGHLIRIVKGLQYKPKRVVWYVYARGIRE